MKNSIKYVSANFTTLFPSCYGVFYVRRNGGINSYLINSLTQYQRAVKLLNMFVERNMNNG